LEVGSSYDYDLVFYRLKSRNSHKVCLKPDKIDPILISYGDYIEDFFYVSENMMSQAPHGSGYNSVIDSSARTKTGLQNLFVGVTPSAMFDRGTTAEMQDPSSALGASEVLYTARGSQGSSLDNAWISWTKYFGLALENWKNIVILRTHTSYQESYFYLRPLWGSVVDNLAEIAYYGDYMSVISMPLWSIWS